MKNLLKDVIFWSNMIGGFGILGLLLFEKTKKEPLFYFITIPLMFIGIYLSIRMFIQVLRHKNPYS